MPLESAAIRLWKQYGDHYIPDSYPITESEPDAEPYTDPDIVPSSVIYEQEVYFLY